MSRASTRHELLVNNLANVNTPGFKRKDIDFNVTLDQAHEKLRALSGEDGIYTDPSSLRIDGNNVDMETEVMGLSETAMRYQALTQMTAGYFADLKNVIQGVK